MKSLRVFETPSLSPNVLFHHGKKYAYPFSREISRKIASSAVMRFIIQKGEELTLKITF
jgi:hypothetical protein